LRFVLDGMAAEVSFELPPARFTIFLVGEPKAFPFVIRRCLLPVMGILGVLAGDEGNLVFMVVRGRKRENATKERAGDTHKGWRTRRGKAEEKLKKHFRWEKAVTLVSLSEN
jgi:hypothetical protein